NSHRRERTRPVSSPSVISRLGRIYCVHLPKDTPSKNTIRGRVVRPQCQHPSTLPPGKHGKASFGSHRAALSAGESPARVVSRSSTSKSRFFGARTTQREGRPFSHAGRHKQMIAEDTGCFGLRPGSTT